jgi:hypothetical protein
MWKLTTDQVQFIENQYTYTNYLYDKWVKTQGDYVFPNKIKIEPYIFVIPFSLLNNSKVFLRKDGNDEGDIAGRYQIGGRGWIFVTERIFTKEGYTDLPHEVVHWLNENIGGITGTEKDEVFADKFEKVYQMCGACR